MSCRIQRRLRHRNQRRLSAHIPRMHPMIPKVISLVRALLSAVEPLILASSEVMGYRPFTHWGCTVYYRVDNQHLLTGSAKPPGLLLYFDGDHISRAGSRLLRRRSPLRADLARVAAEHHMLSVPVLAPGSLRGGGESASTITINWWVRARAHGRTVRALLRELSLAYGIDMSRIWFAGYSGGAEFLSYELLSHDLGEVSGGGATFIAGGGADGIPRAVRERALAARGSHRSFLLSWHVGLKDGRSPSGRRLRSYRRGKTITSEGGWSAQIAAQEGIAFYQQLGARTALQVTPGRRHTGYPIASLVASDLLMAQRLEFLGPAE